MRILIATSLRGTVGGAETYVRDLIPALSARGHDVGLLFEYDSVGADRIDHGAAVAAWGTANHSHDEVLAEITEWQPDVVYLQGLADIAMEEVLFDAFPVAWFVHTYDGACISGMKRFAVPSMEPCHRSFGAACLALYFPRRCGGLNPITMMQQYRLQCRRLHLMARCAVLLVASSHMREEYIRNGVPTEQIEVLSLFPPGTTPDPGPLRERGMGGRLLFVGRLNDVKGCANLVRAAAPAGKILGRRLHVSIAGDGPDRARIEQLARALDATVDLRGWVSVEERTRLMRDSDVLVVPSLWPEPFGLVGLEAGCVGLPAVAYDVGGIREWLRPGESGELAPGNPPTVAGLAAALVRALADPVHHRRLAIGAWSVAQRFTLERHCGLLESHLKRATARRSSGAEFDHGNRCKGDQDKT